MYTICKNCGKTISYLANYCENCNHKLFIEVKPDNFKEILPLIKDGDILFLSKGFYKGPFKIDKSVRLLGQGLETILFNDEVVLYINADNVIFENLKIERTVGWEKNLEVVKIANSIKNKPIFKNVTVKGKLDHIIWEKIQWNIPQCPIDLGKYEIGEKSEKKLMLNIGEKCQVYSKKGIIDVVSTLLYPGIQELILLVNADRFLFPIQKVEDTILFKTEDKEYSINVYFEVISPLDAYRKVNLNIENKGYLENIYTTGFIFSFTNNSAQNFIKDYSPVCNIFHLNYDDNIEYAGMILFSLFNKKPILFYVQYVKDSDRSSDRILKFTMAADDERYPLPDFFDDKIFEFFVVFEYSLDKNIFRILSYKEQFKIYGRKNAYSIGIVIDPNLTNIRTRTNFLEIFQSLKPIPENTTKNITTFNNFELWEAYLSILKIVAETSQYIVKYESSNHGSDEKNITFKLDLSVAYIVEDEIAQNFTDKEDLLRRIKNSLNNYINLLIDLITLKNFELGTVLNFDEENLTITVKLNQDLYEENLKGNLDIPKSAFLYNNSKGDVVQIKRQQNALKDIQSGRALNINLHNFIFDSSNAKSISYYIKLSKEELLLKSIYENKEQKEAVEIALSCDDLALIQGPPGTGKTTVIAEICFQMAKRGKRVLVTSQTNLAVDNALNKLIHQPIIRPLRVGKAESIAEEGLVFLEENIIDKWLKDTSSFCTKRLQIRENKVTTFKLLLDSKKDIIDYIEKEKNFNEKKGALLIDANKNEFKIHELSNKIENIVKEISKIEEYKNFILEKTKSEPEIESNFLEIYDYIHQNLADNKGLISLKDKCDSLKDKFEKLFYNNQNINSIFIIFNLKKNLLTEIEEYSRIKSLIFYLKNLIDEFLHLENEYSKLILDKNQIEEAKNKLCLTKDKLNNYLKNLNLLLQRLKGIKLNPLDIESIIKRYFNGLSDFLKKYYLGQSIVQLFDNDSINYIENQIKNFENQIKGYFDTYRFILDIKPIRIDLENIFNEYFEKSSKIFKKNFGLEAIDKVKVDIKFESNKYFIENLKYKLLLKLQYYYNYKPNFFIRIFTNYNRVKRKNIILILAKIKKLINNIDDIIVNNKQTIEDFINDKYKNFLSSYMECVSKAEMIANNKISEVKRLIEQNEIKILEIEKNINNIVEEIKDKEKNKEDKNFQINNYKGKLTSLFENKNLVLKIPEFNFPKNDLSIFLDNLSSFIDEIKDISFWNFVQKTYEILNEKVKSLNNYLNENQDNLKKLQEENNKILESIRNLEDEINEYRLWWKKLWDSIPERLKAAFNEQNIYKVEFLESILILIASWQEEYEKELQYLNKYKNIIEQWCKRLLNPNDVDRQQLKKIYIQNANIIGCTCSYAGSKEFMEYFGNFDAVVVDEMSKVSPPELLIPAIHGKKLILIGDHKQLPPFLNDYCTEEIVNQLGIDRTLVESMKQSLFKKLYLTANDSIKKMLVKQYRMHPHIMAAINQFYDEKLECDIEILNEKRQHNIDNDLITKDIHLLWVDFPIEKQYYAEKKVYSYFNNYEVNAIYNICKKIDNSLTNRNIKKEIAIITFYLAQYKLLEEKFSNINEFLNLKIKIGTVDRFQGMESPVVIVSLVHNNPDGYIGFAQEYERINVAFSRAQELLIIVGCSKLFCETANVNKAKLAYSNVRNKVIQYGKMIDVSQL